MFAKLLRRAVAGGAALAFCLGAGAQQGVIISDLEVAHQLAEQKQWQQLIGHLQQWQARGGEEETIFRLRAHALQTLGDLHGAIVALEHLQKVVPKERRVTHLDIFRKLGVLYAQTNNNPAAELALRRALAIRENAATWRKLTDILLISVGTAEEKSKAAAALRKTLSYGEYVNDGNLWRIFANLLEELNSKSEAYEAYEHVVRLSPADKKAWEKLFIFADELNKDEAAKELIVSRLARIDPSNPLASAYRGIAAERRGDRRMAEFHYNNVVRRAADGYPPKWRARAFLGLAKAARNNDVAFQHYRSALLTDPTLVVAWERSIVLLRGQGKNREASAYMDRFQKVRQRLAENKTIPPDLLANL